jgi:hypothetical protein
MLPGFRRCPRKTICISFTTGQFTKPKEIYDTLIDQCSRHDIPPVVSTSLPAEGGTISP